MKQVTAYEVDGTLYRSKAAAEAIEWHSRIREKIFGSRIDSPSMLTFEEILQGLLELGWRAP